MVKSEAMEQYKQMLREVEWLAKSGDENAAAGMSYWERWDLTTRAALTENCIGNDDTKNLRKRIAESNPEVRAAIRDAYKKFEQAIRAEAAVILKRRTDGMLKALEKEAAELNALIATIKGDQC